MTLSIGVDDYQVANRTEELKYPTRITVFILRPLHSLRCRRYKKASKMERKNKVEISLSTNCLFTDLQVHCFEFI